MTEISPYPVPSPATPRDPTTANPLPSPSMYAERQSQWKGRRGKPRCDHCRAHNLKCDRVLPICNHCAWAHRECKYTPLPTPAHRGIPRCDRCRFHNLKCDRSLPVCNNCQHDPEADCNYTPKKRHKVPTDHAGHPVADRSAHYHPYAPNGRSASFLASEGPSSDKYATSNNWIAERPDGGPKGKLPASMYELSSNSGSDDGEDDDIMEIEGPFPSVASTSTLPPPHPHEQRPPYDPWTKPRPPPPQPAPPAQHRTPPQIAQSPHPHHPPPPPVPTRSSSASAPVPGPSKARAYDPRHLEPWYHAHFAPLPRVILQGIRTVNPGDMPSRKEFDAALIQFVAELPPDLREVAMLPPDSYSAIAMAIKNDGMSDLSKRSAGWVGYHHVRLGSRKFNLLVVPREDHFIMTNDREEALLSAYMADIDGEPHKTAVSASNSAQDGTSAFMRIPVSTQIYDVLVYAHKKHPNTIGTLVEARNAGISCITWPMVEIFYRLCPRCMAKNKS